MRSIVLLTAAGLLHLPAAMAMEPLKLQPSQTKDQAISQEQSRFEASSRSLKGSADSASSLGLLEAGPRHPGGSSLLNVGF